MLQEDFAALLKKFPVLDKKSEGWRTPFPMGVFGTLRKGCGNSHLMSYNGKYSEHQKAFLPHFYAEGLSISCEKDACAPFEVYFYEPDQWNKMIDRVDGLEGCYPMEQRAGSKSDWGYYRTLAWLYLLPDNFSPLFNNCNSTREDSGIGLWGKRDLKIPKKDWKNYPRISCWIYSNLRANAEAKKLDPNPIIWDNR